MATLNPVNRSTQDDGLGDSAFVFTGKLNDNDTAINTEMVAYQGGSGLDGSGQLQADPTTGPAALTTGMPAHTALWQLYRNQAATPANVRVQATPYDASTNTPDLTQAANQGETDPQGDWVAYEWTVSVEGTQDLGDGSTLFRPGDTILFPAAATPLHRDNSPSVVSHGVVTGAQTLPPATGSGVLHLFSLDDAGTQVTISPASGESVNGVVDATTTFDAGRSVVTALDVAPGDWTVESAAVLSDPDNRYERLVGNIASPGNAPLGDTFTPARTGQYRFINELGTTNNQVYANLGTTASGTDIVNNSGNRLSTSQTRTETIVTLTAGTTYHITYTAGGSTGASSLRCVIEPVDPVKTVAPGTLIAQPSRVYAQSSGPLVAAPGGWRFGGDTVTIPRTGTWLVTVPIRYGSGDGQNPAIGVRVNGGAGPAIDRHEFYAVNATRALASTFRMNLNAGDVIESALWHGSSGNTGWTALGIIAEDIDQFTAIRAEDLDAAYLTGPNTGETDTGKRTPGGKAIYRWWFNAQAVSNANTIQSGATIGAPTGVEAIVGHGLSLLAADGTCLPIPFNDGGLAPRFWISASGEFTTQSNWATSGATTLNGWVEYTKR